MKKSILITVLFFLTCWLGAQPKPEKAPADPNYTITADELEEMQSNGILLPPVRPAHDPWANYSPQPMRDLPLVYDMRETPWLTSVKTQSNGGCWAYSVMGAVESRWLMLGMETYNLSDNNLKYCHKYLPERSTNGNHWMATSYFARRSGPFHESEDPFPGGTTGPENCPNDLTPLFYIHQSRYTPPLDKDFTKQSVLEFGPLWTLMYYSPSYFNTTSNTYFYGGTHAVNHAGIIVGWNDTLQTAGGTGAWIVKNTYGAGWGEAGYYYVSYFDSQFLQYNGYWPDVMEHETDVHLYQYDEIGGYWGVGFGNAVGYGLVKFEGAAGLTEITKIGTFVLDAGSGVEIKIFEQFDGQLSGLLFTMDEVICDLPGYYTFDLDSTIFIPEGKEFFVQIKYDSKNPANKWPIAVEDTIATYSKPHIETGKFWVAPNPEIWPTAWYQAGHGTTLSYDLCIKAYSKMHPLPPLPVAIAGEDATVVEGESLLVSGNVAENFTSFYWTTGGDGIFDDETMLNPTYLPGLTDISTGNIDLIFHVVGVPPLNLISTDTLNLTIWRFPAVELISPVSHEKFCDCEISIFGTASDPDENLMAVDVRMNDGDWLPAAGIGNWSLTVTLNPGINTITVRAKDDTDLVTEIPGMEVICSIQTIDLPEGWSVISGFLVPDEPDVELLLAGIADNLVVIQNMSGVYAPPPINANTLGNWDSLSGYKIKMLADDQLVYCGDLPESNSASFSTGYKIIPYLSNRSADIDELFDDPANDILYLFDLYNSTIYWPMGEIFTLTSLHPGSGYQGFFINPVTINFPEYEGFFFSDPKEMISNHLSLPWDFRPTGTFHFFSIEKSATEILGTGFIGAFDQQGNCIGVVHLTDADIENLLLVVYGDDEQTPEKDGGSEGEIIIFRFFHELGKIEEPLYVIYDQAFPDSDGVFTTNGMSKILGFSSSTLIRDSDLISGLITLFPNPATESFTVHYPFPDHHLTISLMTIDGKMLICQTAYGSRTTISLEGLLPGIYFLKVESVEGVFNKKLIVD